MWWRWSRPGWNGLWPLSTRRSIRLTVSHSGIAKNHSAAAGGSGFFSACDTRITAHASRKPSIRLPESPMKIFARRCHGKRMLKNRKPISAPPKISSVISVFSRADRNRAEAEQVTQARELRAGIQGQNQRRDRLRQEAHPHRQLVTIVEEADPDDDRQGGEQPPENVGMREEPGGRHRDTKEHRQPAHQRDRRLVLLAFVRMVEQTVVVGSPDERRRDHQGQEHSQNQFHSLLSP